MTNHVMSSIAVRRFFDAAYDTEDRYWWRYDWRYSTNPDDHPRSIITQQTLRHVASLPPGHAVDLGCGEGTDAIRLARLGWTVDAVELSEVGARKTETFAREQGVEIRVHRCDVMDFVPPRAYEVVICNGVLHYIEDKATLIRGMQDMTAPGGVNVISLWSNFTPVPKYHQVVPTFPDSETGTVTSSYSEWDNLLLFFEREKPDTSHDDFERHVHSYIKLIASKRADGG